MVKIELLVPEGIEFISNWKDYIMPKGHCIVDKGVTGCGYTEMCLRNDMNVILCSPRKMLLENKRDQHILDENILYLENSLPTNPTDEDFDKFRKKMSDHIDKCGQLKKPIKFMITYDSAKHLINYLKCLNLLQCFRVVADEMQSIFLDSYFKAEVENSFVGLLQSCPNVIYLSATPMLEKYLNQLDEFKDLTYYELNWNKTGYVETIKLQHKRVRSLGTEASKIIQQYLDGDYPKIIDENNKVHLSKEAVLYFNSVTEITRLIKNSNLKPEQVNILCANDDTNKQKIKRSLGKNFNIGKIPLKGEQNKMFTFCTKTVYLGADFYSDNASTYVFADPNLRNLALDISLDLPQIAGRQRNKANLFKNYITVFYKIISGENIKDRAAFDAIQNKRKESTKLILSSYNKLTEEEQKINVRKLRSDIKLSKYSEDFISITADNKPTYNKLIDIANERAWEVAQKDYQSSVNVTKAFNTLPDAINYEYKDRDDKIIELFLEHQFYSTGIFAKKMKAYCEFMDEYKNNEYIMNVILCKIPDPKFKSYYNLLGTDGCKVCKFREDIILNKVSDQLQVDNLTAEVLKIFTLGDRITKKLAKEKLKDVYKKLNIQATAKATDLEKWFEIKTINFSINNKREAGFEILALKGKA